MLGRRTHEGRREYHITELENGTTERIIATEHIDRGGRMILKDRIRVVKDRNGVVLSVVELGDIITLLV